MRAVAERVEVVEGGAAAGKHLEEGSGVEKVRVRWYSSPGVDNRDNVSVGTVVECKRYLSGERSSGKHVQEVS